MKKIILTAICILCSLSLWAGTSGSCGANLTWMLDDNGTLTISGTGSMTDYSSYSSVPWFSDRFSVKKAIVSDGVTTIGDYAFYGCTDMTSITIAGNITKIGESAFEECSGLATVSIPASVSAIGKSAFRECSGLTAITIPGNGTTIGDFAFSHCSALTTVTLLNGVKAIGESAFQSCGKLASISLPNSVITIGESAFDSCTGLTTVTIGEGVTTIGDFAFTECSALKTVYSKLKSPLSISSTVFLGVSQSEATLYVPVGSKSAYQSASVWKSFGTISETDFVVKGDVTGDGKVDTSDLSALVAIILNNESPDRADVNGDGKVDTTDLSALMAIILG